MVVVLFECVPRMGKKSGVSFTFALPFCFSFFLFGEWGWWCGFLGGGEVHIIERCSMCHNLWFENV